MGGGLDHLFEVSFERFFVNLVEGRPEMTCVHFRKGLALQFLKEKSERPLFFEGFF
jgi:hypothetical protein